MPFMHFASDFHWCMPFSPFVCFFILLLWNFVVDPLPIWVQILSHPACGAWYSNVAGYVTAMLIVSAARRILMHGVSYHIPHTGCSNKICSFIFSLLLFCSTPKKLGPVFILFNTQKVEMCGAWYGNVVWYDTSMLIVSAACGILMHGVRIPHAGCPNKIRGFIFSLLLFC